MIKSLVAAALIVGLAGYAFAQETVPGAPAGTAPMTPAPGTHPPIPGMTPAKTGSHRSHVRRKGNMAGDRARASAHHTQCGTIRPRSPRPSSRGPKRATRVAYGAFFASRRMTSL